MQGFIRAIARLLVMGLVMAAVLVTAVYAGLAATTAGAIGIVLAGVVGLVGVARRPRTPKLTLAQEMDAMLAADPLRRPAPVGEAPKPTAVDSMAPAAAEAPVNPEAGMPRWRRPSLLEARHADYSRMTPSTRVPMRFGDETGEVDVRVVRYAVVPVLDRPDEVLGLRQSDLASGDEVQVLNASGTFLEVLCPNGDQGWVHRTTLGHRGSVGMSTSSRQTMRNDADDALTALLSARGLI